jgi:cysteine desulfurase
MAAAMRRSAAPGYGPRAPGNLRLGANILRIGLGRITSAADIDFAAAALVAAHAAGKAERPSSDTLAEA